MACRTRRLALAVAAAAAVTAAAIPGAATASGLVARNAQGPTLEVDGAGHALVSYRLAGGVRHVLVWGAVDALAPASGSPQVEFRLDYTGGLRAFGKRLWRTFRDRCEPYDGPSLSWLVVACRAPDGSYWALQSWQRTRPFHGSPPSRPEHDAFELRISHWTGELAKLEVWQDWKYSARFESLFGRYTYRGEPVTNPPPQAPGWKGYVRRAYIDTLDSGYGAGWWRADVFSAHPPAGVFCAIFARDLTDRFGTNRAAGARYRVTMTGPGVTPDVTWEGPSLGPWDPNDPGKVTHEAEMNALMASLGDRDPRCLEP